MEELKVLIMKDIIKIANEKGIKKCVNDKGENHSFPIAFAIHKNESNYIDHICLFSSIG